MILTGPSEMASQLNILSNSVVPGGMVPEDACPEPPNQGHSMKSGGSHKTKLSPGAIAGTILALLTIVPAIVAIVYYFRKSLSSRYQPIQPVGFLF